MATVLPENVHSSDDLYHYFLSILSETNGSVLEDPDRPGSDPPFDNEANEAENPFVMAWWVQLTYALAFGLMLTVATIGNAIVIWAVLSHKVMSSATNYFLVNVSVADLMMATFNAAFNFAFMIHSDWPFGAVYCTINNFVATLTVALSVFSMMAISVDRYTAIMKPLRPRMSKHVALIIIAVMWMAGSLLSLPNLLYSKTVGIPYRDGSLRTLCLLKWPDGPNLTSKLDYSYNIVILVVTYVLPISSMSFIYLRIGRELWGSTYIGECCDKQIANIKSKKRVVRMFIVVVTIFAICWLPYHAYFIYIAHHQNIINFKYIQHIYLIIYFVAMSSCMYNPIIYFKMNVRFRQYFLAVLTCRRTSGSTNSGQSGTGTHCQYMSERYISIRRPGHLPSEHIDRSNGTKDGDIKGPIVPRNVSERSYIDQDGHIIPTKALPNFRLKFWVRNAHSGIEL